MVPVSPFQLRIFHMLRFHLQPLALQEPAQLLSHHGDSTGTSQPKVSPGSGLPLLLPEPADLAPHLPCATAEQLVPADAPQLPPLWPSQAVIAPFFAHFLPLFAAMHRTKEL